MSKLVIGGVLAALTVLYNIPKLFRETNASSWTDITKSLRVEPVTLVDERCLNLPYIQDVLYTATATTAAYYLQAVAVQGSVGRLDVVRVLDGLNPNRDTVSNIGFMIGDAAQVAMLSHTQLPMYDTLGIQEKVNRQYAVESMKLGLEATSPTNTIQGHVNNSPVIGNIATQLTGGVLTGAEKDVAARMARDYGVGVGNDALKAATDIASLSVGAMISVEISDGKETRKVPVTIRLIVSGIKPAILSSIFDAAAHNRTIKERYHAYRAGQIEFIKDMIFCQDIIDEDIKNRIEDTSGAWREMKERQSRNRMNTILSLGTRPSIGTACNVYVMSKETLIECEQKLGGRISNRATREKLFANTLMMLLYVVDTKREVVEVWHRGQGTSTIHSVKEMRMNGKERNASIELNEAFKAYTGTGF